MLNAECTYGLADVDVPKFLSRPRLDFADLSSPCFVPACDPVPPVSSACSIAFPPVQSSSVLPARSSSVAVPFSSVFAPPSTVAAPPGFVQSSLVVPGCSVGSVALRPVYAPPVVVPSSSVVAPPGFRPAFDSPSPVGSVSSAPSPVRSVLSGPVPHCPVGSFAQLLCLAFVQPSVPVGSSPFCRPFLPLACLALVVVPVLLPTPFGFVLSFLAVLR